MSAATTQRPIDDAERQRCEIWSRVMGYHRPVARRFFTEPAARVAA